MADWATDIPYTVIIYMQHNIIYARYIQIKMPCIECTTNENLEIESYK